MELALIVLRQTLTMGVYMLIGFGLYKAGLITKAGSKSIANLLVYIVIPALILNSFLVEFSPERLRDLGVSALVAAGALLISGAAAWVVYPKSPIDNFGATFSNCGFIGIPLVRAALGDEAVFLTVAFIAIHNNLQFTYGMALLKGEKVKLKAAAFLKNPILIATAAGLIIFCTGLGTKLPSVISGAVGGISAANSPLAMMILGVYLAQTEVGRLFTSLRLYKNSAVRLLLVPVLTFLFLWAVPCSSVLRYAIFITAAAPVGASVAMYSEITGGDYPYACQTVTLSSVLSIITLPALTALAGLIPTF